MSRQRNSDEPPPLPRTKKKKGCFAWGLISCGVLVGVMVAGAAVLGFLLESGYLLPSKIIPADELNDERTEFLRNEILEDGETAKWFYSAALRSIREDGNLLTDQRVIGYFEDEDEFELDSVRLEDVVAVRAVYGTFLEDGELHIWARPWVDEETGETYAGDAASLLLLLSAEEDQDHRFVEDLIEGAIAAGAELVSIELGGTATADELDSLLDATRFSGSDSYLAPAAVTELMPE